MPWKKTSAFNERSHFIFDYNQQIYSISELCRMYGITRRTGYKWLGRYQSYGPDGLRDRSRAPKHHPNATNENICRMILDVREEFPTWGPKKIHAILSSRHPGLSLPSKSTIGDILQRHGLTSPRKKRSRAAPSSLPFSKCNSPNTVWCADFKGWFRTGDGSRCNPLTITDAHSRYLICCQSLRGTTLKQVQPVFISAFKEYGMPYAIRTDNGVPFASHGISGLSKLSVWWITLGIVPERIDPGKPQQNGRHERMHLTLKNETASPPQKTLRGQQRAFNKFQHIYNEIRPHEALGQVPPASFYKPSTRAYKSRPKPYNYPSHILTRKVQSRGEIFFKNRKVFIGEAFIGDRLGLELFEDDRYRILYRDYCLGEFDSRRFKVKKLGLRMR